MSSLLTRFSLRIVFILASITGALAQEEERVPVAEKINSPSAQLSESTKNSTNVERLSYEWSEWKRRLEIPLKDSLVCQMRNKKIPSHSCEAKAAFRVDHLGKITDIKVIAPSKDARFDSAVVAAIERLDGSTVLKFPDAANNGFIEVVFPFNSKIARPTPGLRWNRNMLND